MMRVRTSMVLLAICVGALVLAGLRLATERTPLPTASSYSTQPDGAMGLYEWAQSSGARTQHVREATIDPDVSTLFVLQPEVPLDSLTSGAYDDVASRGGTLVVAGVSVAWLLYARSLGVTVDPMPLEASNARAPDGLSIPFRGRYRLSADGAQSLLVLESGATVALRLPYNQRTAIVVASSDPLTNAALRDDTVARFVVRYVLPDVAGRSVAFDEMHHSFAPDGAGPVTVNTLLLNTAPGRAVTYVAVIVFLYVLLSGRRLGPPLSAPEPSATQRTMYEHIQMLADLYRRAGQFRVVKAYFAERYARTAGSARIQSARNESELASAVAGIDDAS